MNYLSQPSYRRRLIHHAAHPWQQYAKCCMVSYYETSNSQNQVCDTYYLETVPPSERTSRDYVTLHYALISTASVFHNCSRCNCSLNDVQFPCICPSCRTTTARFLSLINVVRSAHPNTYAITLIINRFYRSSRNDHTYVPTAV